jgi:hypothetical protein
MVERWLKANQADDNVIAALGMFSFFFSFCIILKTFSYLISFPAAFDEGRCDEAQELMSTSLGSILR